MSQEMRDYIESYKVDAAKAAGVAVVSKMSVLCCGLIFVVQSKLTRWHNFTLGKEQHRLDVRTYSFFPRTIDVCNTFSTGCVYVCSRW